MMTSKLNGSFFADDEWYNIGEGICLHELHKTSLGYRELRNHTWMANKSGVAAISLAQEEKE